MENIVKIKIISAIIIFLFIIAGAAAFFIFSETGWKIINYLYPTANLTIKISEKEIGKINNFQEKAVLDYGTKIAESDGVVGSSMAELNVKFPESFPDSTVIGHSDAKRKVVIIANDVYVEDPYDNTYSAAKDSTADQNILNKLRNISFENLQKLISDSAGNFTLNTIKQNNIKTLQLLSDKLPSLLVDTNSNANGKFVMNISQDNYLPESLSIKFDDPASEIKNISVSFSNYNGNNISVEKPALNEFGDFLARESIYIRTDKLGSHDYLWPLWEQKYFGCTQCVNKIWDEDDDKLNNIEEFIFGSDPKNKDSNSNGIGDSEELQKGQNMVTSLPISAPYISASKLIMDSNLFNKETDPKIDKQIRSPSIVYEVTIPKPAEFLILRYGFEDSELSSYFTAFFNNKLLFKATANPGEKIDKNDETNMYTRTAFLPVDEIAGQKGVLTLTLNSVGSATKAANLSIETEKMYFK